MRIKQTIIVITVFVGSVFTLVACNKQPDIEKSGKSVKIGFIVPFSGPDEEWGPHSLLGTKTALIVQPYLLNGDKPEIIAVDDQNKPELTKAALKKLVEVDKVSAILVSSNSEATLAAAEVADAYKTPILALMSTHPDVTNNNYVSQLVVDDSVQATVAALFVIDELFIDHVAVFTDSEDLHSTFLADEFARKFEESGGVTEKIHFTGTKNDYSHILQRLHEKQIDFLYLPLGAEQIIQIEKATREIDWHPQVMVSDGILSSILLQFEDDLGLLEGMLAPEMYSTFQPRTDYGKKVTKVFKGTYDTPGTAFTGLACEGTSLLLSAMNRCSDSSDRACINRKLRSTEDFTGLVGKIRLDKNGKAERPIFINVIKDASLDFVVKIY